MLERMFENSIFIENCQTLQHKFKRLNYDLFAKNFVTAIFQTLFLSKKSCESQNPVQSGYRNEKMIVTCLTIKMIVFCPSIYNLSIDHIISSLLSIAFDQLSVISATETLSNSLIDKESDLTVPIFCQLPAIFFSKKVSH